jgi:hypothetical protein
MEQLSIGATVGATYNFTFRHYLRILGVTWFPSAVTAVAAVLFFFPLMGRFMAAAVTRNPAALMGSLGPFLLGETLILLIALMIGVGVTRLALGRTLRWPFFFFTLGADFWRSLLAVVLLTLLMFVLLIVVSIGLGIVVGLLAAAIPAGTDPTANATRFAPIVIAGVYGAMLFLMVRFGMLLPSIVIAERRIGLGRSWVLSRGHFWRLLAIFIVTLLPLIAIGVLQFVLTRRMATTSVEAAQLAWSQHFIGLMSTYYYIYVPVVIAISPIYYGLFFGCGAFAYRALMPASTTDIADTF